MLDLGPILVEVLGGDDDDTVTAEREWAQLLAATVEVDTPPRPASLQMWRRLKMSVLPSIAAAAAALWLAVVPTSSPNDTVGTKGLNVRRSVVADVDVQDGILDEDDVVASLNEHLRVLHACSRTLPEGRQLHLDVRVRVDPIGHSNVVHVTSPTSPSTVRTSLKPSGGVTKEALPPPSDVERCVVDVVRHATLGFPAATSVVDIHFTFVGGRSLP